MPVRIALVLVVLTCRAMAPGIAAAQVGIGPQPLAYPPSIPAPRDVAFAGALSIVVDATDFQHRIFAVTETIPVQSAGAMILLYPAWEPGSHAKTAPVADLAGLVISAAGQALAWQRDPIDTHAFHLVVPENVHSIDVQFQYLAGPSDALLRADMVNLQWHRMVLYPAGWFARNISVKPSVKFNPGLRAFSSLDVETQKDDVVHFKSTTLEALTDSPVYAARHSRQVTLSQNGEPPVRLDLIADKPGDLAETGDDLRKLRAMVEQTTRLFGSTHYAHYDAIVSLSDQLSPGGGLEHLESGENNLPANYFTQGDQQLNNRDLIAHEFAHSWNGRFRQPADLWTPTLNVPMRTSLLWVYEGQTEFWGRILAARSGLRTQQETFDKLALDAALVESRKGRQWKTLADSNNDPLFVIGHRVSWRDWQRREDYYPEGVLLWLEVDAMMRERSGGKHGLDDFAAAFFGINDRSCVTVTYTFEDVCAALGKIVPYDWATHLRRRLDAHDAGILEGLARQGWRLVYTDTPTETFRQDEIEAGAINLIHSIGLTVKASGDVRTVAWHGPAFEAGLSPGARITSVNGKAFAVEDLKTAIKASASKPVEISYEVDEEIHKTTIDYRGPLRYPKLERVKGRMDRLSRLLTPIE